MEVRVADRACRFELESGARRILMEDLDAIALTQTSSETLGTFHENCRKSHPWC
jgi:3-isopropylmalate dehydratase small subunit